MDTFVYSFWFKLQKEKNEKQMWEIWLHKDYDHSFVDFKKQCGYSSEPQEEQQEVSDEQVASTITNSRDILLSINPSN